MASQKRLKVSLSAKILAPMLLLITLFATNTLYSAQRLNKALEELSAVQSSLSALPDSFREVRREAGIIEGLLQRWHKLEPEQKKRLFPLRFASLNARLSEALIRLEAIKYPVRIEALQRLGRSLLASYVQLESEYAQYAQEDDQVEVSLLNTKALPQVKLRIKNWRQWILSIDELNQNLLRLSEEEAIHQQQTEEEALQSALLFTSLSFVLGLAFMIYLSRLIEPIRSLTEGVTAFGQGHYSHRIHPIGSEEFYQLALALNRMGEAIELRDHRLLIEQQKRLQEASLTAAGHLSAQITHELRNPLSSIGLNSELLAEELFELDLEHDKKEELSQLLGDISREIERLKGITEEYLRYARIPPPELNNVDLNALCSDLIDFSRAEAQRANITLILDPDPIPRVVQVDSNQLRSALINLIRNACEALDDTGGYIKVSIRTGGGEAQINIKDNGPGIPKDQINKVFEPFFSTKPQGTGLGLSMVQQLIKVQGGRVILEPEVNKEGGASFSVYLPLVTTSIIHLPPHDETV